MQKHTTTPFNTSKALHNATITDHCANNLPDDNQIIDTNDLVRLTGLTKRFWESRRISGDTPPYIKLSARAVRYRWGDVVDWLNSKKCNNTSDDR